MGQEILQSIRDYTLDNIFILFWIGLGLIIFLDFYSRFVKIQRNSPEIDLLSSYAYREIRRRQ